MASDDFKRGFQRGYIGALYDYGIWKGGVLTVGCLETPVRKVVKEFDERVSKWDEHWWTVMECSSVKETY